MFLHVYKLKRHSQGNLIHGFMLQNDDNTAERVGVQLCFSFLDKRQKSLFVVLVTEDRLVSV